MIKYLATIKKCLLTSIFLALAYHVLVHEHLLGGVQLHLQGIYLIAYILLFIWSGKIAARSYETIRAAFAGPAVLACGQLLTLTLFKYITNWTDITSPEICAERPLWASILMIALSSLMIFLICSPVAFLFAILGARMKEKKWKEK